MRMKTTFVLLALRRRNVFSQMRDAFTDPQPIKDNLGVQPDREGLGQYASRFEVACARRKKENK